MRVYRLQKRPAVGPLTNLAATPTPIATRPSVREYLDSLNPECLPSSRQMYLTLFDLTAPAATERDLRAQLKRVRDLDQNGNERRDAEREAGR